VRFGTGLKEELMSKKVYLGLALLVCLLALPTAAHAQSAIAGVVKDSSGAVLPGVTVEASSDVLIEKSRVAVTDGSGAYKLINLRPGTYLVTVTLTGFQTFKREGLEIPSDFTANLDVTLKVGALEESVTVSGASPVVDVQSNVKSQVLSREVLDAVPNAHTIQSVGQLIPGVTLTSPDVGGSAQMQQTYFSVHGTGANGTSMTVDGMIINGLMLDGAVQTYMNDATAQELVYRTGGGGGEQQSGGLQINVVPREGGNRFSGQFNFGFEKWQSDNFGDELRAVGVTSIDKLGTYHDISATEGGPIKKDRLWWFASGRLSLEKKPVANTTNSATYSVTPIDTVLTDAGASNAALAACRAAAAGKGTGTCAQGISDETVNSANGRLTLQVNSKNKLSAYLDRIHKDRASAMGARDDQRITGVHWDSPMYMTNSVKWTSTVSSRLLIQGGWSSNIERYNNRYQEGLEQPLYSALWYSMASRVIDGTGGVRTVTGPTQYGSYPDRYNWQGSASYVTGSHNVSVGFQDSFGTYNQFFGSNADMYENFTTNAATGVVGASTVLVGATQPRFDDKLDGALGIYAQDNWTMKRLTVNYGVRWDRLAESVVGQGTQQGTFAYILAYPDKKIPVQTNWEPHVSVIYDLFGSGKTALRAGFNRYVNGATTTLARDSDPGGNPTLTANWTDVNGDGVAQYQVTHNTTTGALQMPCTYNTLGCEVNFPAATGFATYGNSVSANVSDPNLKRPYQDKFNIGVSHELLHGVSVSAEFFQTNNKDIQQTFNVARAQACGGVTPGTGLTSDQLTTLVNCNKALSPAQIAGNPNFRAVQIFSPIDGHAVTVYDQANAAVNALGAANFVTTDPDQTNVYKGFDFGVNARLPKGGRVFGGTTTERTIQNDCDTAFTTPANLIYCDRGNLGNGYTLPWKTQIKLAGTYPLPFFGIIVNGSYQGLPGYNIGATTLGSTGVLKASTYVTCPGTSAAAGCTPNTIIVPGQVATTLTATLDPANTTLTPRNNQVDFGIAKRMKFGRLRVDPKIDLFNALNSDDYYSVTTATFSPIVNPAAADPTHSPALPALTNGFATYRQPSRFLQGRIMRLGANITW
jgi:hypothetical protein